MGSPESCSPLLVTGVPRSGTTWLARGLASDPHTSMPGREPMNPRGRQFALGGRVDAWVRRDAFGPREAAVLRRCYRGREVRTLSRYGIRQWAAVLPRTRIVVKDPFAILSLAAIHEVTGALPVVVYRHPAAVLASYRRMGWTADTRELVALGAPEPAADGDLHAMAAMWSWCHQILLQDLRRIPGYVVVSHQHLTAGGPSAWSTLGRHLGLDLPVSGERTRHTHLTSWLRPRKDLHDFSRSASDVESGWQRQLAADEIETMEGLVMDVWNELEATQLPLAPTSATQKTAHDSSA